MTSKHVQLLREQLKSIREANGLSVAEAAGIIGVNCGWVHIWESEYGGCPQCAVDALIRWVARCHNKTNIKVSDRPT